MRVSQCVSAGIKRPCRDRSSCPNFAAGRQRTSAVLLMSPAATRPGAGVPSPPASITWRRAYSERSRSQWARTVRASANRSDRKALRRGMVLLGMPRPFERPVHQDGKMGSSPLSMSGGMTGSSSMIAECGNERSRKRNDDVPLGPAHAGYGI